MCLVNWADKVIDKDLYVLENIIFVMDFYLHKLLVL